MRLRGKKLGLGPREGTNNVNCTAPGQEAQVDYGKSDSFLYLLGFVINEVAVLHQLADEGIDLPQGQRDRRAALQVAADEAVVRHPDLQGAAAQASSTAASVLLGQRQHAEDAAHAGSPSWRRWRQSAPMCEPARPARHSSRKVPAVSLRAVLVLMRCQPRFWRRCSRSSWPVCGIEQADVAAVPLHLDLAADPARRRAVVGGLDFHAAIQIARCARRTGSSETARGAAAAGRAFSSANMAATWRLVVP